MTQWGNCEPLIKQWGNCRELNDLMRKTGNFAPDEWNINFKGLFDDAMGKLESLAMMKLGSPDDLMGKFGALDH